MRLIQSDAYNKETEVRINKLSNAVTPEQVSDLSGADVISNFDSVSLANPETYNWVSGSVNGFDISKIKALINHRKFKMQDVLDLTILMPFVIIKPEGAVIVTGGQTGGEDEEVNFTYETSSETTWKLIINIPDGWDGRNSFIKMPWDKDADKIKGAGPAYMIHKSANTLTDVLVGFTILKDEKMITIKYRIPSGSYKKGVFFPGWFQDLTVKMWRPKNVSRR